MVNVAGRSKGCSTCRRRRIKCGKRPQQYSYSSDVRLTVPKMRLAQYVKDAKSLAFNAMDHRALSSFKARLSSLGGRKSQRARWRTRMIRLYGEGKTWKSQHRNLLNTTSHFPKSGRSSTKTRFIFATHAAIYTPMVLSI
jgi:hypothetical protein